MEWDSDFQVQKIYRLKRCVYTVILGDYDEPKQVQIKTPGYDYILFTDNPCLLAPGWKIRLIDKSDNPQLKQREIKILAHKYLPEYHFTLYLDGSTMIRKDIGHLVTTYFRGGMLLKKHPTRNCIYQEAEKCIELKKAPKQAISAQIDKYRREGIFSGAGLYETGIILRENKPPVNAVCEAWWEEVRTTCNRDQISLPVILRRKEFVPSVIPYQHAHVYIRVFKHKTTEDVKPQPKVPKIHYLTPFAVDKNIGREYNEAVRCIPANDWICLRDGDTIFLTPDNQWGKQISDIVAKWGNSFDLIGCVTNRLRSTGQLYQNRFSDDHDMLNHGRIARELYDGKYDQVRDNKGPVAGLFLLFPKRTWDKVKFREGTETFDTHFGKDIIRRGGKIGIAEGVYLYHWYRAWTDKPLEYTQHLKK